MEMYRLDSSQIEVDYFSWYDHMQFNVRLKDAALFDTTGYPYTVSPKLYAQNP